MELTDHTMTTDRSHQAPGLRQRSGRAHITDRKVDRIPRIASHHPDIDFSLIGP